MSILPKELELVYDKRRDAAEKIGVARKKEVYALIPALADLEDEVMASSMRFFRKTLQAGEQTPDPMELEMELDALKTKRSTLLTSNGFDANYLNIPYLCRLCNDTGYITTNLQRSPCSCSQALLQNLHVQSSNLKDDGETGFAAFNALYYPEAPNPDRYGTQRSPRAYMQEICETLQAWVAQFDDAGTQNLYLHGNTGTGKTWLAKSVGLALLAAGKSVLYMSAPVLFDTIRAWKFADTDDLESSRSYRLLSGVDLLIIDDLGTEPASDARFADLLTLLEARAGAHSKPKRTLISTNLDIKRLYVSYNERIGSRIAGSYNIIRCIGDDIRLIKRKE